MYACVCECISESESVRRESVRVSDLFVKEGRGFVIGETKTIKNFVHCYILYCIF